MAEAVLQARVDSGGGFGPVQEDAIVIEPDNIVRFVAPSFAGWTSPAAYYQFARGEYPSGWPCPDGWTDLDGTYRFTCSNLVGFTPPDVTFPSAGGIWGKWRCELVVNGNLRDDLLVEIVGPGGVHDIVPGERTQYDEAGRSHLGPQRDNLRRLDGSFVAIGTEELPWKEPVRGVAANNVADLASFTVAQGDITYVKDDRVFLGPNQSSNQATSIGIFKVGTVSGGAAPLTRASDADTAAKLYGATFFVRNGAKAGSYFRITNTSTITLNTTILTFEECNFVTAAQRTLLGTATAEATNDSLTVRGASGELKATWFEAGNTKYQDNTIEIGDGSTQENLTIDLGTDGTSSGGLLLFGGALGQFFGVDYAGGTTTTLINTTKATLGYEAATSHKWSIGAANKMTLSTSELALVLGMSVTLNSLTMLSVQGGDGILQVGHTSGWAGMRLSVPSATEVAIRVAAVDEVIFSSSGINLAANNELRINNATIVSAPSGVPTFGSDTGSNVDYRAGGAAANRFFVGGTLRASVKQGGLDLEAGHAILFGGVPLLTAPAGVVTLGADASGEDVEIRAGSGKATKFYDDGVIAATIGASGVNIPTASTYAVNGVGHSASATALSLMFRDAAGRAQVASPSAADDIVIKSYADALGTSAATADTIARRAAGTGLLQASGFTNGSGTKASAGTLRASSTENAVVFRNAGDSANLIGVSINGDDRLRLGADSGWEGVDVLLASSKSFRVSIGGMDCINANDGNVTFGVPTYLPGDVTIAADTFLTEDGLEFHINTGLSLKITSGALGFFGATPVEKPTVAGSRGGNVALASLLTALANEGLITNSTTA